MIRITYCENIVYINHIMGSTCNEPTLGQFLNESWFVLFRRMQETQLLALAHHDQANQCNENDI